MTTFHSRQSDRGSSGSENGKCQRVQFQITNCIINLHCCVHETYQTRRNNFQVTVQSHGFDRVEALPLVRKRFLRLAISLPKSARRLARRARDGRGTSGKKSDQISRARSAHLPGNGRAEATAIPRTSVKTTRKTACLALDLNLQCPRRKLARQPAICPRNSRAAAKATSRKRLLGFLSSACNHDLRKL